MQDYSPWYSLLRCNHCAFKRGGMGSSSVNAILLHLGPQLVHLLTSVSDKIETAKRRTWVQHISLIQASETVLFRYIPGLDKVLHSFGTGGLGSCGSMP